MTDAEHSRPDGVASLYIHDWIAAHARAHPDDPAVDAADSSLSYGELHALIGALASTLVRAGTRQGDRVLVALPNAPATVVATMALGSIGAVSVEVNRAWGADVLQRIVGSSGVRQALVWGGDLGKWGMNHAARQLDRVWVVHREAVEAKWTEAFPGTPITHIREDGTAGTATDPEAATPRPDLRPDDAALILYTSGSTGAPHGVIQTFRNIDANTRSIVAYLGLTRADRALLTLPLFYCYGRSVLQTHLLAGGSVYLENRTAFPRTVLELLAAEACTGFAGVPSTFEAIRRQVDVSSITFDRLRYLTQAGGAMSQGTIDWVRREFRPARLFVMYGQTEATARLSYLPPGHADEKRGSIGIAIPGVELRVVDEQGRTLPDGDVGELVARGANVTPGYLDDPEETARVVHDGWLWTGDLASRDADGFYYHRGRVKEILKVGGHRVSPVVIEHVVAAHPDVAEAAVCGIADEIKGEVPIAFIVVATGGHTDPPDLARFCRQRLASYEVPIHFFEVDALPRNEAGKLLRAELPALVPISAVSSVLTPQTSDA